MKKIADLIRETEAEHRRWGDARIAETVLALLTPADQRDLALAELQKRVWVHRRLRQLEIERVARTQAQRPEPTPADQDRYDEEKRRWAALRRGSRWALDSITDDERIRLDVHIAGENEIQLERDSAIWGILVQFKKTMRLELTAELLTSEFATGDGRQPTWGEATRHDHELRQEFMVRNYITPTLDDAAMHLKAIEMLDEHGVDCLNEVAMQAATA